jgi:hypothetical protein
VTIDEFCVDLPDFPELPDGYDHATDWWVRVRAGSRGLANWAYMVYNRPMMKIEPFILIKPNGSIMVFTVRACAELYLQINGGTIIPRCCENTTGELTIAVEPV